MPEAIGQLEHDLRAIFGGRLRSLVTYRAAVAGAAAPVLTVAVVETLTADDLHTCAGRVGTWRASNLGTPLLLPAAELSRSLDAFPLEFGGILASYQVVAGGDPFEGMQIDPMHLRMACEVQARSHLLHLREDYLETEGRGSALAALMAESAPALASLVESVARLDGAAAGTPQAAARHVEGLLGLQENTLADIVALADERPFPSDEARRRWPGYLDGVERLARHVDRWPSP